MHYNWKQLGLISIEEYFYLVACIVEGIPYVSNISGTYSAFHKTWEKRSYKKYELVRLDVITNRKKNKCYNTNGVELVSKINGDILYIDPPYNSRQYLPNYHVLETGAKYDFPEVRGITAQRAYEKQKSDFCIKRKVVETFSEMIKNAKFKNIILSYSTDGLMSLEDIEAIMLRYGIPRTFQIYKIPYRRYKSRSLKNTDSLNELLIYVKKRIISCILKAH